MAFKSFAQFKKFAELVREGKIKKDTYLEWWHATDFEKLPEKIKHAKPKK